MPRDLTSANSILKRLTAWLCPCQELILNDLENLTHSLTIHFSTDVEKFRVIYRWIADNISYDLELFNKNKRKEIAYRYDRTKLNGWKKKFNELSQRRLITKRTAVCSGYAALLENMCQLAGLSCVTIPGYSRTLTSRIGTGKLNHAWNAVKLDRKWYLCDPTWSSGAVDENGKIYYSNFNESYFLTEPDVFIADHYPQQASWTLTRNRPSLNEFLKSPIALDGYRTNKIVHFSPKTGVIKAKINSTQTFCFTTNLSELRDVTVEIAGRGIPANEKRCHVEKRDDGYLEFEYKFLKKGFYRLYLRMRGHATLMYEVYIS